MINISKNIALQALDCGQDAKIVVNAKQAELLIEYVNPAFEVLTGHDASAVIGTGLRELVADGPLPVAEKATKDEAAAQGEGWPANGTQNLVQVWNGSEGDAVEVNLQVTALYERPGKPSYWLLSCVRGSGELDEDLASTAELKMALDDARRQLKSQSRCDTATGLPNQKAFLEVVKRDWSIARREQRAVALMIFRVEALDEYRDLFGRHATDSLLNKIGHAISGSLRRAGDLCARFDQDRFAVLVSNSDLAGVTSLADRIAEKVFDLSIHHPRSPIARFVTVSSGVAAKIPDWSESSVALIEKAEQQINESCDRVTSGQAAAGDSVA